MAIAYLDSIISKNSRMVVGFVSVPKFTVSFVDVPKLEARCKARRRTYKESINGKNVRKAMGFVDVPKLGAKARKHTYLICTD